MKDKTVSYKDVDDYVNKSGDNVREKLKELREIIKTNAPDAEERIGYGMPGYYLNGPLVYFGGFKNHVSLFGTASKVVDKYKEELKSYKTSKGTIQFPLDEPLPINLIKNIVVDRVKENLSKS